SLLPASLGTVTDEAHRYLDLTAWPELVPSAAEQDPAIRRLLKDHLGSSELAVADVAETVIEPDTADDRGFYRFLVAWFESDRHVARALEEVACVRTHGGGWRAPSGAFFPRQREDVTFPEELQVP